MNKKNYTYNNFYFYVLLVLPLFVIYTLFFAIPLLSSIVFSFTNYNGVNLNFDFVGLKNYIVAFDDTVFRKVLLNTFYFALGATILQNGIAIAFSIALNTDIKSKNILRALLFAPCVLSSVVVAFIWQFIYMPEGLLNEIFGTSTIWLGNTKTALICIIIAHVWRWCGYSAMIYLANLQSISGDIIEASQIDGANYWQRTKSIILPLLAPAMTINITLAFTQSLKVFDIVYAMTNGGPLNATETVGTYAVAMMGRNLNGYASALTVLLSIVIIFFGKVLVGYFKKKEEAIY